MDLKSSIIIGLVQGLTEFLPVSSSAHLVFIPRWLGLTQPDLAFDVLVHLATLLAVIVYFRKEIIRIIRGFFKSVVFLFQGQKFARIKEEEDLYLPWLIIVGSIPTAIIGFCFKDYFESLFSSIRAIGYFLIVTGFLLWFAEKIDKEKKDIKGFSFMNSIFVGVMQGIAIAPGISRSGATISASMLCGLKRNIAARYSFLLAIPAILGASIFKFKEIFSISFSLNTWIAFISAFVSGYMAISVCLYFVSVKKFRVFSLYVWGVGIILIYFSLKGCY